MGTGPSTPQGYVTGTTPHFPSLGNPSAVIPEYHYVTISANWHTHTYRCKHADGDVVDYCRAASAQGLTTLGFSDHAPLPDGRWSSVRMEMAQLREYADAIDGARDEFPGLRIVKGLECEYVPELAEWYRDVFRGEYGMDYLVGGAHWYPYDGRWESLYGTPMTKAMLRAYTDYVIESIVSGLFAFIAHPDLFGNAYYVWDGEARACSFDLLSAAASENIPLEINAYGLRKPLIDTPSGLRRKYPWLPFWALAGECGVRAIVNSDAHEPRNVAGDMEEAAGIAQRFGLVVVADPLACPAGP